MSYNKPFHFHDDGMDEYRASIEEQRERDLAQQCGFNAFEASNYTPAQMQERLTRPQQAPITHYHGEELEPEPQRGASGFYECEDHGGIQYTDIPPLRLTLKFRAELEAEAKQGEKL